MNLGHCLGKLLFPRQTAICKGRSGVSTLSNKQGLHKNLEGTGGEGDGREAQDGGDVYG